MKAFFIFLMEAGLATALVAGGAHLDFDLSLRWAALLPLAATFVIFLALFNTDFYLTKKDESVGETAIVAMLFAGIAGIYAAPAAFVLTGAWAPSLVMFAVGAGLIVLMFVSTLVMVEVSSSLRARDSDGQ